jgi:ribose 5-phosphate isomerase RpiB
MAICGELVQVSVCETMWNALSEGEMDVVVVIVGTGTGVLVGGMAVAVGTGVGGIVWDVAVGAGAGAVLSSPV